MLEEKIQKPSDNCSDFPSEALLCIKEVDMVDSLEEFESSRSIAGKNLPNFEMLDARIASALNKIIQQFLRGRQIAFVIYDHFRVIGAHDTVLDYADLFSVTSR